MEYRVDGVMDYRLLIHGGTGVLEWYYYVDVVMDYWRCFFDTYSWWKESTRIGSN